MLDDFLRDRAAAQRLRANPVGSHLDGFTAWLSQRGYAWTTIRQHVWALSAFGQWLHRRGRPVKDLRRRDADDFCRRRCAVHRRQHDLAALRSFLDYLEAEHLMAATPRVVDRSPLASSKIGTRPTSSAAGRSRRPPSLDTGSSCGGFFSSVSATGGSTFGRYAPRM